jgi:NADH-quinone oxidoreductase subunit J
MAALFYLAGGIAILAGLSVVLQRTPVYSALSLIVVLCALAVVYLLLGAQFLAVVQIIVYAGATMVVFVLVIMLLNAGHEGRGDRNRLIRWMGGPLLAVFLVELIAVVWWQFARESAPAIPTLDAGPVAIGKLLFQNYVLPFEVTSILILVAVLGAVVLAKRES